MEIAAWAAVAGLLLIVMALGDSLLARLPLSTSMLYLAVGVAASPLWFGWTHIALESHTKVLERIAEVVVLLSLFGSGLKMSLGLSDGRWLLPLRLASLSMLVTVALVAAVAVAWRYPCADRSGARFRRPDRRAGRPRSLALCADRRGRPQRRHRLSGRVARPRPARPA
jgi:NhaP-type Na+/H+ or K+/H+ antiporter